MLTKPGLKKEFSKDWKKYYQVELFKEKGFTRKLCSKCGKAFWTLNQERSFCGDSPCQNYEFIGKPITNKKYDYIEMWKAFEKFFVQNGHTSIPRYPVIDRWRQDLYFTIASIQDFQRLDNGNMTFVYPANPLIVPQVSLRFGDIQNVGVTGRHLTSFVMSGQHAFNYPKEKGSYFKDKCIELNFNFLNKALGIPEKELVYHEDFWSMPDFSEFGPSLETFSQGLELVNSVFTEFQSDDQKTFRPLDMKVIDVGWGHERLVWFSNGTEAAYDCLFGPVTDYMKKASGIRVDPKIFSKYSKLAGGLDIDEKINMDAVRKKIADSVGISVKDLVNQLEPLTAIYAIADHTRTLLFAIADGGIPSNIGGGYNLRVILRRCLSFIKEYGLDIHLIDIAEKHAKFLKPVFPELESALENMGKILDVETDKYKKTVDEGRKLVVSMIKSGDEFDESSLVKLYESHGITPETVKEFGKENKIEVQIPENFYGLLSKGHILEKKENKKIKLDLTGLPDTKLLFYKNPEKKEFDAKVLKVLDSEDKKFKWIILDETLFYPEGGGQEWDLGKINGCEIVDVQKFGHIAAHKVTGGSFKVGEKIHGTIDWNRRTQLMHHHTAIHI
ncbi:MAG TPA: alanine--tRNA ligase-related protein, partial [archaeon]|nr:alanine--tRNA ligase-related protein [archaeon]